MKERADDGQRHASDARENATACGGRIAHPFEREDEQRGRDEVDQLNELIDHFACPGPVAAAGSRFLNIFSMRSVMRKPLTMLVVDANTAMAPSHVLSSDS